MERVRASGPGVPPYEPLMDGMDMEGKTRSTVVTVETPLVPPPRDHLAWSLCTTLYANVCCLGFLALVFSVKSRDRKVLGDYSGALSYGSTAKYLNITAHLINVFLIILIIALVASGTIMVANIFNHQQQHPEFIGPT
ncbi:interferon-induced transmembrane protein 3 [Gallus gallus]|uniref:interferon-induced transmembrane protein 3 n=1 Tax=Gallus gallus TaxID=9031 RepID=UPI000240B84D|nr:interferon-induced transmembrane protein 3 [Gallus gallus]|eukprot:NP_001336990.1 interferon-induced transmembrane protein 3 [Gallus gallus]